MRECDWEGRGRVRGGVMIDDGGITARRSRRSPANRCAYVEIARVLPVRWIGSTVNDTWVT